MGNLCLKKEKDINCDPPSIPLKISNDQPGYVPGLKHLIND